MPNAFGARPPTHTSGLVVMSVNPVSFVAPNLAWGEARGGSIPRQWGCDRRPTKPQAKFGATLRAAVLFGPGGVARSLQIHWRDMLVARALPGPKTPRRKRHRIYAHDHLARTLRPTFTSRSVGLPESSRDSHLPAVTGAGITWSGKGTIGPAAITGTVISGNFG